MSLLSLFDKAATVYHLAIYGSTGDDRYKEKWQASGTTVYCALQPMDAAASMLTGGQYGQGARMFCRLGEDIREGDKVVYAGVYGTRTYIVRGIEFHDYGRNSHQEILLDEPVNP